MPKPLGLVLLAALTSLACRPATSPSPSAAQSAAYVIRLGNDTIAVDQYTRTGNRIEGTLVQRSPRASVTRYLVLLNANGTPASIEQSTRLPDGSMIPNAPRSVTATFTADSIVSQVQRDSIVTIRMAARDAFPTVLNAFSLYAVPIAALRASGRDSAMFASYAAGTRQVNALPLAKKGANRYWVYYFGNPFEITTDDRGNTLSVDGSRTTLHIVAMRQPTLDVAALATAFAERERQSRAMGALSPRDTVTATISGAQLWVDYSRPTLRGRRVFGANGVLGDSIWRTGANAATQFTTSAPITLAGLRVPAGTYTLWTVPRPKRADLVVNTQTGQWGTEYDGSRDLGMARMAMDSLAAPVEKFTISITGSDDRHGTLAMEWGPFRWTAPIVVLAPDVATRPGAGEKGSR